MELIDRYLQAVQFWLPANLKRDIAAEISQDLYAQIEEREAGLSRKLTRQEISDLLKRRGSPITVAHSYLPQRSLIGPMLYPVYIFVLRLVLIAYFVPWVLTLIGRLAFSPAFQAGWVERSWIENLTTISGTLWSSAFIAAGVVTLVFAVLERTVPEMCARYQWDPARLPPVRYANRIPRANSFVEVAISFVAGAWMAATLYSPVLVDRPQVRIVLTPVWSYFYWGFLMLTVASIALSAANLVYPYWTPLRATLRMVADVAGSAFFCWLLKVNIVAEFRFPNLTPEQAQAFPATIHHWMNLSFPYAVFACLVVTATAAYRIVRAARAEDEPGRSNRNNGIGTPVGNFPSR
jgi:hypothetical protein